MSGIVKAVSKTVRAVGRVAKGVVKTAVDNPELILLGALTGGGAAAILGKSIVKGAIAGGVLAGATGAISRVAGSGAGTTSGGALLPEISPTAATPPPAPTPSSVTLTPASTPAPPRAPVTGATTPSVTNTSSASPVAAPPVFAPSPAQHITVNAPIAPTPPVQLPQIQASAPSIAGQRSRVGSGAGVHTSSGGAAPPSISGLTGTGSAIVSNRRRRSRVI